MARKPRNDTPGSWHHVMNRAISRRSMFETNADIRFFLSGVARAVRRGEIEVHAWCALTTHYHMLVRSPKGELSSALRRVQNRYVRYFNRKLRRDGTLLRGRFRSKLVNSLSYRKTLVRYIDANPVRAGRCADPCRYEWGSARQYAQQAGPRWLSRSWVESWVIEQSASSCYDPSQYPRQVDARAGDRVARLVASRLRSTNTRDDLDSLLEMPTPAILAWLRRKAMLADGRLPEQAHVDPSSVTDAITAFAAKRGSWRFSSGHRTIDAWSILHSGLLRDLACTKFVSIGRRLGVSDVHARRLSERHRRLVREDMDYGRIASSAVQELLNGAFAVDQRRVGRGE